MKTETSDHHLIWPMADLVYLSEEALAAAPGRGGVVNVDVVVLSTDWLLHERFLKDFPVDFNMVLPFHQVTF